jgi:enamine deaminase RidA (YjgF/YER057c/UK114 family)
MIMRLTSKRVLAHAVKIPGLIFLSGQTPVDSAGNVVPGDIKVHTASSSESHDALYHIKALSAGSMHL